MALWLKQLLLILIFLLIDRVSVLAEDGDDDDDECGDLNKVVAFFELEILVGSKASFCTPKEKADIGRILKQLLDDSFAHVPNLERATANVCTRPVRNERERNLMLESENNEMTNNQTIPSWMKLLSSTDSSNNDFAFFLEDYHNEDDEDEEEEEEEEEEEDDSQFVSTIDENGIVTTTKELGNDIEQVQRILVGQFVYRGGLRCTFCIPDDADARRQLADEDCRQRRKDLFQGFQQPSSWRSWENGNKFRNNLMGPYSSGDAVWRDFRVPRWADLVRIRFQIYHVGDDPWVACDGDRVVLEINGDKTAIRPPECNEGEKVTKQRGRKYSLASKPDQSGTKVIVAGHKGMFRHNRGFEFSLTVKTSNGTKQAAFGDMIVRAEDTCTTVKPNHVKNDNNKHNSTSSFEDRMQEIFTKRLSRQFRKHVQKDSDHCLHGANPTVYVNLFPKETWEEAQPDCI